MIHQGRQSSPSMTSSSLCLSDFRCSIRLKIKSRRPQLYSKRPRTTGARQGFHTGCSYLDVASSFPSSLQRCQYEDTQLAWCLRERQDKAVGDVPLPIKLNGTKLPCVLHEFYLPGSLLSTALSPSPPSGPSCPLGVFGIG